MNGTLLPDEGFISVFDFDDPSANLIDIGYSLVECAVHGALGMMECLPCSRSRRGIGPANVRHWPLTRIGAIPTSSTVAQLWASTGDDIDSGESRPATSRSLQQLPSPNPRVSSSSASDSSQRRGDSVVETLSGIRRPRHSLSSAVRSCYHGLTCLGRPSRSVHANSWRAADRLAPRVTGSHTTGPLHPRGRPRASGAVHGRVRRVARECSG